MGTQQAKERYSQMRRELSAAQKEHAASEQKLRTEMQTTKKSLEEEVLHHETGAAEQKLVIQRLEYELEQQIQITKMQADKLESVREGMAKVDDLRFSLTKAEATAE